MFIIIFQFITAGKTEVTEECFIQNDNTNFLSNISFFSKNSCCLKTYENHGTCRQAGRDVRWRKRQLCCASQLIETKIQILSDNVELLISRNMKFGTYTAYMYVCIFCT
jgi:hypothetical protein